MIIRRVKSKDMNSFLKLREDTLAEFGYKKIPRQKLKKEFLNFLKLKNKIILLAEDNKIIKGYVSATLLKNVWQRSCYIDDIFVAKNSRREGIGQALLKELIKLMKSDGIKKFRLGVEINNKAVLLYKKIGLKITQYEMTMKI